MFTFAFWGNDLNTTNTYTDSDWHHWAGTFDAVTRVRTLYRDGVVVATDTASSVYQGSGLLNIASSPGTGSWFGGDLDEVRMWAGARSSSQIVLGMNNNLGSTEPGLLACWRFDEGSGTTTADATSNAFDLTLLNAPRWLASTNLAQLITGLQPRTLYHFRLVGSNSAGLSFGK